MLVSHVHRDHLDRPSLRAVASRETEAVVPVGAAKFLDGMPFGAVREVAPGDRVALAGVDVAAVPAWHDGRRRPGAPALDTLGFVMEGVWFAGDTGYHADMAALRGSVEVALLPIWGWGASLGAGHLDPEAAARVVALVAPRVVVPIHWGTFLPYGSRRRELLVEPAERFAAYARDLAPATRVATLSPGGSLSL